MFEQAWIRYIVVSLLFGSYASVDMVSRLVAWRQGPPRVGRPLWSHLLGFASVLVFYHLIGAQGGSLVRDRGNQLGLLLSGLAMVLRFILRGRPTGGVRYPDLSARLLFFAALPLVAGSPASWIGFTLPQALIAAHQAHRRDRALAALGPEASDPARVALP